LWIDRGSNEVRVGVKINNIGSSMASAISTATVADAALTATSVSITGTEGANNGTTIDLAPGEESSCQLIHPL
jgi:hypothetical protein